jgi:hypothetical protein
MYAFGGIRGPILIKRDAEAVGELFEEAILIDHVCVHKGIHERLALVRSGFERVAEACGLGTTGGCGCLDEDVDQSRHGVGLKRGLRREVASHRAFTVGWQRRTMQN